MKNRNRIFPIISLFVLFILTIATTFAWFFINKELEIDYVSEIVCEAGTSLEISMLEGLDEETQEELWSEYSGYIRYTGIAPKIEDITGDGKNLYAPTSITNDPETGELVPEGLVPAMKTNSDGFGHYLEVEVKLRTTSTMNVYLSGDSFAKPVTTSDTDRNIYGNFSKDFIAGAMRVAILEKDENGTEELKMIWAPNPTIHLYRYENDTYDVLYDEHYEQYCYYKYNEETEKLEPYYVTSDEYADKEFVLGSTGTDETMVKKSPIITTLSPSLDEVIEKRLVIRVWYEGTDREANQALGGGQVNLNLKFIGMQEKEEALAENKQMVDNFAVTKQVVDEKTQYVIEGINDNVYFSLNGYTWYLVNGEEKQTLINYIINRTTNVTVYLRYAEDAIHYEYMIKKVFEYSSGGTNEE